MWISPASSDSTPDRIFRSVLLPAPLSPTSATISPRATERLAPRRTSTRPNDFQTPTASIAGAVAAAVPISPAPRCSASAPALGKGAANRWLLRGESRRRWLLPDRPDATSGSSYDAGRLAWRPPSQHSVL